MSKLSIFELAQGKNELELMLQADELSSEDYDVLQEEVKQEIVKKGTSLIAVDRTFEANIKAIDEEIERLKAVKDKFAKRQAKFHSFITAGMKALDMKKMDTPFGTISITKSVGTIVEKGVELPDEYMNIKEIPATIKKTPDKKKIKKAIEEGVEIDGCYLEHRTKVVIK